MLGNSLAPIRITPTNGNAMLPPNGAMTPLPYPIYSPYEPIARKTRNTT